MEQDEILIIWKFTKDFWQLIKKYYVPPQDAKDEDAYWHDLLQEASELGRKYGNRRICVHLINGFIAYLEEITKT